MASAYMEPHQELKDNGRYSPAAQEPELTGDGRYSPTDSYSATSSTFNMLNNHTRHPNDPTSFPPAASLINQKKHLDTYTISQLPREMKKLKTSALSNLRNQLQDGSRKRTSTASFSEENSDAPLLSRLSQTKPQGGHLEIKRSRLAAEPVKDKPRDRIGVQVSSRPESEHPDDDEDELQNGSHSRNLKKMLF